MFDKPQRGNFRFYLIMLLVILSLSLLAAGCGLILELLLDYDDTIILTVYEINDGELIIFDFPEVDELYFELQADSAKHEAIWNFIVTVIPAEPLAWFAYLQIVTDGIDGILGSIEGINDEEDLYILSIDILDVFDEGDHINLQILAETVMHELGHILTLNETQVRPVEYKYSNPDTFYTDYGDTLEDSYLNLFFQRFWLEKYDEWLQITEIRAHDRREQALYDFYEKYEDHFVSDYAVTDPDEDIAETFMCFILEKRPRGRTIAEEKILFLYQFPELVELRTEIRKRLAYYNLTGLPPQEGNRLWVKDYRAVRRAC